MTDPPTAFREAAAAPRVFWLDGGGARPWSGSRSVLGVLAEDDVSLTFDARQREVRRHQGGRSDVVGDDVFAALGEHLAADRGDPSVSWVGYLGYACRTDLPGRPAEQVPDAVWLRVPATRRRRLAPLRRPGASAGPLPPRPGASAGLGAADAHVPAWYRAAFAQVQRELRAGNSYEVNLTYRERRSSEQDPVATYLRLRGLNPAPYAGYLHHPLPDGGSVHLLSSSPERFATVDRHRVLEAKPIKGTAQRGATAEADERERVQLATDPKTRAENLMIVDLLRNDLAMVCAPGTVIVPSLMAVESYEAVHQLVSTVRGRLRPEVDTVAALRALFPAGSMTGAPKRRTMEIVDAVEESPRGVYAGAFGWLSADGRADLSVVIRSLVATRADEGWDYTWGTGGGITVRSVVDDEWAESRWKADRLLAALGPTAP